MAMGGPAVNGLSGTELGYSVNDGGRARHSVRAG